MANRIFTQFHLSLVKQPVMLWGKAAIGAVGAPTLDASKSKGIASIVRNSAGNYSITLSDPYVTFLGFSSTQVLAAGVPPSPFCVVRSYDLSTKVVVVEFVDYAGAAVELTSGTALHFKFELDRSSV
jgi:hypothetical protein